jgi:putative DNA primase/helicase
MTASRLVPPPSDPMAVARQIVADLYTTADGVVVAAWRGDVYRWTGTHWSMVEARDVRAELYEYLEYAEFAGRRGQEPWEPTRRRIDDVLDAMKAIVIVASDVEPPVWIGDAPTPYPAGELVSMHNGLLHLPTRTLVAHTPQYFSRHALAFDFRADAPAPSRWLQFLHDLWPDDEASIDALAEMYGYVLAGGTAQQKIFLLVGPKRGGKGTIGRVLTGLLGAHNVAAPTLASLSTNFGLSPLIGRPLALISDARLSGKADGHVVVERLLSVSGEDSITVDRKYRDPWTGRLSTRFVILTNELPRLSDSSGALASRFVVFVLRNSFYGRENPALTDELLVEAPSIFAWALAGLDRLRARGYFEMPASGEEAVRQLEDLASPIGAFVRDMCVVGAEYEVPVDAVWGAWKQWCESDNRHAGTRATFGRDLRAAVPTMSRGYPREGDIRVYVYRGIGLGALHRPSASTTRTVPPPETLLISDDAAEKRCPSCGRASCPLTARECLRRRNRTFSDVDDLLGPLGDVRVERAN